MSLPYCDFLCIRLLKHGAGKSVDKKSVSMCILSPDYQCLEIDLLVAVEFVFLSDPLLVDAPNSVYLLIPCIFSRQKREKHR